jgi:GntP family gluconate:H+ symporter
VKLTIPSWAILLPLISFLGNPITALLISVLCAYVTLGFSRGLKKEDILKITDGCFGPVAGILLVIGAGGAFNQVLQDSGIGKALGGVLISLHMNPILLAWIIALIMRFAVGSTTVAMVTAAGIILPIMPNFPGLNPALLCVAFGAGGVGLSHVNDSGFWIVKEYYGMSVQDTFKTWTLCTTIASFVAVAVAFVFSLFV